MTADDWAAVAESQHETVHPASYSYHDLEDPESVPAGWELSAERLGALRYFALCAQKEAEAGADKERQRQRAYEWVGFVVSEEGAPRSFFLQVHRTKDSTFYRDGKTRPRKEWPPEWKDTLCWLKHPHRLTVAELELALAIFRWDAKKATLVWWAQAHPHILWRVHRFLLRRYCFELLRPIRSATARAGVNRPAFRAGELAGLFPRVAALTFAGTIVALHTHLIFAFVSHAPWWAGVTAFALILLSHFALIGSDVFRENRGLLRDWRHAFRPRILPLLGRTAAWAVGCGVLLWGAWSALEAALPHVAGHEAEAVAEVILRAPLLERIARTLLLTSTGSLIGWVVEWVFGSEALTEPI